MYRSLCLLFLTSQIAFSQGYEEHLSDLEDKAYEHFYSNRDSSYFYFNKINKLAIANNQIATAIDNLNYVCFSAGYFYDIDKIKSTIEKTTELVKKYADVLDTLPDRGEFQKNYLNFNKGIYFHKLEDFEKAQSYFEALANQIVIKPKYQNNIDDLDMVSKCYSFIAQMNVQQRKYKIANDYHKKNIRLFKRFKPEDLEGLYKVYNLYGKSFYEEGSFEKAKNLWLTSLNFNEKNFTERNRNSIVTTALMLSKVYRDLNKIDSASFYLRKVKKYKQIDDPFTDRYLIAKGEIQLKKSNTIQALQTFKTAIDVSLVSDKARLRKKIGELYLEMDDVENALQSFQRGIIELAVDFNSKDYSMNPRSASVKQKNTLLSLLTAKASALATLQDSTSKTAVLGTVNSGLEVLDQLRPTFKNQNDKLNLIEDAFNLFETGIEMGYQLQKTKGHKQYIDSIFHYSEKSKSVLLLEALLASKASSFANIPKDLLERERQLKYEITFYEKLVNLKSENNPEKEDLLFALQEQHRQLIKKIETEYKTYYDLKYNNSTVSLSELQRLLEFDEILISYFYGNEAIYAIGIDRNTKHIERIPINTSLENTIKEVHQMLGNSKSNVTTLSKASHKLYASLIEPFKKSEDKKKLIIIADGLLNYIPFGALNIEENGLSYLVEKHAVSYANSATLYSQLLNRNKKKSDLLAFAPSFNGEQVQINPSRDKLLALPHNKREVAQILTSFEGQSFINKDASLQNFTSQLSNFGMLHLATHAVFDDTKPEYSYLAFSTTDDKESLLYVSDLYNLQINADLVTLSACETGVGELKRGEGFLSLARGFFYSGASSIASTLWKVNDASTSSLMDAFYKNLSEGDSKDIALQNAKKTFLKTNRQNGLSHPYYWSGFIISGNTTPIHSTNYWFWIGLGVLLSIVAGFLVFRNKKG